MAKWKPSKTAAREFANTMNKISDFCSLNGINHSKSFDSYYFTVNGQSYRVSNHTIEKSNSSAFDSMGNQIRELYHDTERKEDVFYIHAGKTRIIDIYNDLKSGRRLDHKGNKI